MHPDTLLPVHPGEILLEDFLKPLGISEDQLANDLSIPTRRIHEIVQGKRPMNADTALRLARYFSLSERFWMNIQSRYDLDIAKDRLSQRLEREVKVYSSTQPAINHT